MEDTEEPGTGRSPAQKIGIRNTIIGLVAFIVVVLGLFLFSFLSSRTLSQEQYQELGFYKYDQPRPISKFELVSHKGHTVGLETLRVRWTLMFFGFTYCPDICPTTMGVLARAVDQMERAPRVIMVSVDPERDTPEQLANYVPNFHEDFVGYTGEFDEIVDLATQLNIAFGKVPGPTQGSYLVDHSASIVVVNPSGEYTGFIKAPHDAESITQIVESLQRE